MKRSTVWKLMFVCCAVVWGSVAAVAHAEENHFNCGASSGLSVHYEIAEQAHLSKAGDIVHSVVWNMQDESGAVILAGTESMNSQVVLSPLHQNYLSFVRENGKITAVKVMTSKEKELFFCGM